MPLFGPPNIEKLTAKRDVKGLIKALRHDKKEIRADAAHALGEISDPSAVEPLIAMLRDDSSGVREIAIEALGKLGSTRAVEPLTAAIRDNNSSIRREARAALEKLGWTPGTDETAAWYWAEKGDWPRCRALGALAVNPLMMALNRESSDVREAAAETLGQIGDPRAVEPLCDALDNRYYHHARGVAAKALGQIGDPRAVKPLCAALDKWEHNEGEFLWQMAAEALGQIGDAQAIGQLVKTLNDWHTNKDIRITIIRALGQIGGTQAVEPVCKQIASPDQDVREAAAGTLAQMESAAAIQPLLGVLADRENNPLARVQAARLLVQFGRADAAVGPLIGIVQDSPCLDTCGAVASTLAQIGNAAAEPLSAAIKNIPWYARPTAADTLDQIGWTPGTDETAAWYWIAREDWQRCVVETGNNAVGPLLSVIKDPKVKRSKLAAEALVQNIKSIDARRVIPPLVDLFAFSDLVIRRRAAGLILDLCLADMCQDTPTRLDAFAVDLLAGRFEATQLTTVQQARLAGLIQQLQPDHPIAAQGQTIFDRHSALLSAGSVADRAAGAEVIAAFGTQDAEARILDVIDGEKSPDVLKWLAEGLGYCGSGKPAVNKLIGLLDIDQSKVRRKVADALAALGDPAAVGPLERTIESKAKTAKVKGYHAMTQAVDILKYV